MSEYRSYEYEKAMRLGDIHRQVTDHTLELMRAAQLTNEEYEVHHRRIQTYAALATMEYTRARLLKP